MTETTPTNFTPGTYKTTSTCDSDCVFEYEITRVDCVLYALPHRAVLKITPERVYISGIEPVEKVFQDHYRK